MKNNVKNAVARLNKILPLAERQKALDPKTANIYRMILKSYVELGRTLNKDEVAEQTDNIEEVINILRANDLVVFDCNDEPIGAYPFTMEQRDHQIIVNDHTVHAMCALDALAISPMFKLKTHITSRCSVTGNSISIDQIEHEILNYDENNDLHFGINWNSAANNCCATSLCTEMIFLINKDVAQTWRNEDQENREIFNIDEAVVFASNFFTPLLS